MMLLHVGASSPLETLKVIVICILLTLLEFIGVAFLVAPRAVARKLVSAPARSFAGYQRSDDHGRAASRTPPGEEREHRLRQAMRRKADADSIVDPQTDGRRLVHRQQCGAQHAGPNSVSGEANRRARGRPPGRYSWEKAR